MGGGGITQILLGGGNIAQLLLGRENKTIRGGHKQFNTRTPSGTCTLSSSTVQSPPTYLMWLCSVLQGFWHVAQYLQVTEKPAEAWETAPYKILSQNSELDSEIFRPRPNTSSPEHMRIIDQSFIPWESPVDRSNFHSPLCPFQSYFNHRN